jgi:hypothetical protein
MADTAVDLKEPAVFQEETLTPHLEEPKLQQVLCAQMNGVRFTKLHLCTQVLVETRDTAEAEAEDTLLEETETLVLEELWPVVAVALDLFIQH